MRGASWMSGQPRESQPRYRASPALAAKIGFNHSLVGLDDAGRALGQLLAVVEDEDRLAEPHDDLHVVLHEEHGLAPVAQLPHGVQELVEQGAVDPRRRLVEQDEIRVGHEHADELHQLLLAVGEIARVFPGEALELDEAEELLGAGAGLGIVIGGDDQEILERRQIGKDPDDLERAADALVKDLMRLEPVDPAPLAADLALVARLDAGDAVEQRGLARAIGPDQAVDAAGLEAERYAIHGGDAAKALEDTVHLEDGRHQRSACRQCGEWSRGHPPRTTLTRNPLERLVRSHEIRVFDFGSAQKIRVHGGCPLPHSPPRADEPLQEDIRQMVRGRLYFCWRTPRMPRGMRSTTATMMVPKR